MAIKTQCSILMLKERTETADPNHQEQSVDLYETALHSAFAKDKDSLDLDLTYLAPLTVLTKEPSLLSRSIAAGLPPLLDYPDSSYRRYNDTAPVWAFAVTSQSAVRAVVKALEGQPDSAIRDAWLRIPIYTLTGATMTSVKNAGFKNINPARSPPFSNVNISQINNSSQEQDQKDPTTHYSFDNAEQLVEFLVSFEWPQSSEVASPELWFLTGETRMKTLAEKLKAHNRPFQEIVVYETGPRPGFEQDLQQWLSRPSIPHLKSDAEAAPTGSTEDASRPLGQLVEGVSNRDKSRQHLIWLVGFSPRGVDLTWSTLTSHLSRSTTFIPGTRIQWAAIGQTTAKRIKELLATLEGQENKIESTVAVAKAPNPTALAESIYSHSSSNFQRKVKA